MEIRDPIHGGIRLDAPEVAVVRSPFFQRLRRVKQLGFAEQVFPGATHHRFLHSIGVMHLAGRAFDIALRNAGWLPATDRARLRSLVRLAALCHDVGHAPLSHASEILFPSLGELEVPRLPVPDPTLQAHHEHYTLKLLLDSPLGDTVRRAYAPRDVTPEHAAALLHGGLPRIDGAFTVAGHDLYGLLAALISSEVDVDRMDYLQRDSYFTGVKYGEFDHTWLLGHLTCHVDDTGGVQLAIEDRALYTFDDFLLSRYHMFLMVYFHYKVVCYDEMLRRFARERPDAVAVPTDPEAFLLYDDASIHRALREHGACSEWARGIVSGRPLVMIAERWPHSRDDPVPELQAALHREGFDFLAVTSEGALSKYGGKNDGARTIHVRIQPPVGEAHFEPLGTTTRLFERYAESAFIERLYVHPRDEGRAARMVLRLRAERSSDATT